MRSAALPAVVALAVCALVFAAPAPASERHPTLPELETELICPVCPGETLDQSDAPIAQRMKSFISERIAAGDTKSQIKAKLVAQFGPAVLASPPKKGLDLLVWVLPLLGLLGGAVVLALLARRWSRGRAPGAEPEGDDPGTLEPDVERRLDEELARFDA
jgi:cytochrome c-type biogenesis protein CcmH